MLTAGMSTRAAPHLFDVHFTTISCHSCQCVQLVSHGVHVTTSAAHDLCPRLLHLHGYLPRQQMQQLICKTRGSLHRNCRRVCGMGRHDVQQAQVLLIIHVAIWMHADRWDEILRPIVEPVIRQHHLVLQHDNTRHHVWESENITAPAYSPGESATEHVGMLWIDVRNSMFYFLPISRNISHWGGVDAHSASQMLLFFFLILPLFPFFCDYKMHMLQVMWCPLFSVRLRWFRDRAAHSRVEFYKHTCTLTVLYDPRVCVSQLSGGWIISEMKKLTNTDLNKYVPKWWECIVYLTILLQLVKRLEAIIKRLHLWLGVDVHQNAFPLSFPPLCP